ncbi:ROK family protein [Thermodesulfobacteriota bacterium]
MTKKATDEIYALGVDLGGNNLRWGLVSSKGEIVKHDKVTSRAYKDKDQAIAYILNSIAKAVKTYKKEGFNIKGVGFALPGLIIKEKGYVHESPNFKQLNGVYVKQLLEEMIGLPVIIENDVNAWAWGEHTFGKAKKYKHFMVMTLGTGVGGGVVLDGNLLDGEDGTAGEVGHMTIYPNGLECQCGNFGCLERYASGTGLVDNLKQNMYTDEGKALIKKIGKKVDKITPFELYTEAKNKNKLARRLFKQAGTTLGIGIANLVNLLNLDAVVIGGGVSAAWDIIVPELKKEMKKRAFSLPAKRCKILKSTLGDNGGILGMAEMILEL